VSSSSGFKWLLTTVLLLSIAWKITIPYGKLDDPRDGLVEFLKRYHFEVVVTEQNGVSIIKAERASCQLQIARLAPNGSNRNLVEQFAIGQERSFVVFSGEIYRQQPILRTVINYLWFKGLGELGFIKHITPAIAVAANSSCDAERLPWHELREIS
jgi:hypothetical protein